MRAHMDECASQRAPCEVLCGAVQVRLHRCQGGAVDTLQNFMQCGDARLQGQQQGVFNELNQGRKGADRGSGMQTTVHIIDGA